MHDDGSFQEREGQSDINGKRAGLPFTNSYGKIPVDNAMVEAAGIEPASESTTLRLLHVYPDYFISDPGLPPGRRPEIPSPFVLLRSQRKLPGASPLNDAVT